MRTEKTVCCKDGKYRSCGDILGEDIENQATTEVEGGTVTLGSNKGTIGSNKNTDGGNKDIQPDNTSSSSTSLSATEDSNSNEISAGSISSTAADNATSG